MRLSLHDVATDELLVRQQLTCESITNIDDAVVLARKVRPVINLRISIIVEEDVLGVVVSLVNQQELGNLAMVVVLLPVLVVLLDGHAGPLLKSLQAVLELRDDVVDEACVLELLHVVEGVLDLLEHISDTVGHACAELGVLQLVGEAVVAALLVHMVDSQVLGAL